MVAARGHSVSREAQLLATASAAGLSLIDITYVAKSRIAPVYLLDAISELALLAPSAKSSELKHMGEILMKPDQLNKVLLQSLEHGKGGVKIYETALKCALNSELREDWQEYLEQTRNHVKVLTTLCTKIGLKPDQDTPGQQIVRHIGASLVQAMEMALKGGKPDAAQLVACECVVLAETKDHMDWALIGQCAEQLEGDEGMALQEAYEEIENQEDEHLYHTKGWARELWIEALGMTAVLPPPEEVKQVKTAIGAAKAEQARLLTPGFNKSA